LLTVAGADLGPQSSVAAHGFIVDIQHGFTFVIDNWSEQKSLVERVANGFDMGIPSGPDHGLLGEAGMMEAQAPHDVFDSVVANRVPRRWLPPVIDYVTPGIECQWT
jgi:hypothetical protein